MAATLIWLAAASFFAGIGLLVYELAQRHRPRPDLLGWSIVGGLGTAGLFGRLSWETPTTLSLAGRPVDPVVLAAGGLVGALVVAMARRNTASSESVDSGYE